MLFGTRLMGSKICLTLSVAAMLFAIPAMADTSSDCGMDPKHVHLAVGKNPSTSMTVSFASSPCPNALGEPIGAVFIGTSPERFDSVVTAKVSSNQYHATLPLHHGKPQGNYTSDYFHHVTIENLKPKQRYYYRCVILMGSLAEEEENENEEREGKVRRLRRTSESLSRIASMGRSEIFSFVTAPAPGAMEPHGLKFAFIGDMANSDRTSDTMRTLSSKRKEYAGVVLAGDLAYPHDPRNWDTWFDMMASFPVFSELPWQVAPGNHDIDWTQETGDIFLAYESRFKMPQVQEAVRKPYLSNASIEMNAVPYPLEYDYGNAYYSFIHGPSHHIVLNSYGNFDPGSMQYEWLVRELELVDRTTTPWLLVTLHCPMYNTYHVHSKDIQLVKAKEHLEPLFVKHRVNVVVAGHIHAYMRTHPVIHDKVDATGPVHIVVGDGGRKASAGFKTKEPEEWIASRDATYYGYGTLEILNRTHSRWEWVHTAMEQDHNEVWHKRSENATEFLPPVQVDSAYIVNQYYL